MENLYALVLAGGKGTRLGSEDAGMPKAMREVNGRPILAYMLEALSFIKRGNLAVVVGYMGDTITAAFPEPLYAVQEAQRGTGDAAKAAVKLFDGVTGDIIVVYGDMALLKRETYLALAQKHLAEGNDCTMLGGIDDGALDLSAYGRIVTDADGGFREIIEAKDYTEASPPYNSYNAGLYVFRIDKLFSALERLTPNNAQGEYYLTDAPAIIKADGGRVGVLELPLGYQLQGVNTPEELIIVENYLRNAE